MMASEQSARWSIAQIAQAVGVSERALRSAFQLHLQATPSEFHLRMKLDHAHRRLSTGSNLSIGEIADECGFSSRGRFAAAFRARFGRDPSKVTAPGAAVPAPPGATPQG